jgi:hypothetical protein
MVAPMVTALLARLANAVIKCRWLASVTSLKVQGSLVFRAQRRRALQAPVGCRGLAEYRKTAFSFFSGGQSSGSIKTTHNQLRTTVWPNPSFNTPTHSGRRRKPGLSQANIVSVQAYGAYLRGRG